MADVRKSCSRSVVVRSPLGHDTGVGSGPAAGVVRQRAEDAQPRSSGAGGPKQCAAVAGFWPRKPPHAYIIGREPRGHRARVPSRNVAGLTHTRTHPAPLSTGPDYGKTRVMASG